MAYIDSRRLSVCLSMRLPKEASVHLDRQAMTTAATVSDVRLSCCEGRHPCIAWHV